MVISCFFCQNLLSDFIEGILPSSRHEQLKGHLESCKNCTQVHQELLQTLKLLKALPAEPIAEDMALRITEASQARKKVLLSRQRISRAVLGLAIPLLGLGTAVVVAPEYFPWLQVLRNPAGEAEFVRYYPLLQGASEILEEQSSWLHSKDSESGSLWEAGGLSPEEFEKTFQMKGTNAPAQ
jgi:Putative zinc-finger